MKRSARPKGKAKEEKVQEEAEHLWICHVTRHGQLNRHKNCAHPIRVFGAMISTPDGECGMETIGQKASHGAWQDRSAASELRVTHKLQKQINVFWELVSFLFFAGKTGPIFYKLFILVPMRHVQISSLQDLTKQPWKNAWRKSGVGIQLWLARSALSKTCFQKLYQVSSLLSKRRCMSIWTHIANTSMHCHVP